MEHLLSPRIDTGTIDSSRDEALAARTSCKSSVETREIADTVGVWALAPHAARASPTPANTTGRPRLLIERRSTKWQSRATL